MLRPGYDVGPQQVWAVGMLKVSRIAVNVPVQLRKRCADATPQSVTGVRLHRTICDVRQSFGTDREHASFQRTILAQTPSIVTASLDAHVATVRHINYKLRTRHIARFGA